MLRNKAIQHILTRIPIYLDAHQIPFAQEGSEDETDEIQKPALPI